jgi:glycosyltransferase involved in cell wall biosynthesis
VIAMSSQPLISIITPFFNAAQFLGEAVESAWAQTYRNWELLLIDDGSTDDSSAIAQRFAADDPARIRYLSHENCRNRGASAARNLGLRHATGEYVAFLDADDVWLPQKLSEQARLLARESVAMLYGRTQYWYSWTRCAADRFHDKIPDLGVAADSVVLAPALFKRFVSREIITPCTCSILVRRSVIEEIRGFEEQFHGMYDDQVFYAKLTLRYPVFVAGACWDKYRRGHDSCYTRAKATGESASARLKFLTWLETYLSEHGIEDEDIWNVLRNELRPFRHPLLNRLEFLARNIFASQSNS